MLFCVQSPVSNIDQRQKQTGVCLEPRCRQIVDLDLCGLDRIRKYRSSTERQVDQMQASNRIGQDRGQRA